MPLTAAEEFARSFDFTLAPPRVHYQGRSAAASLEVYAALVTLAGCLGGRVHTAAFARCVGVEPSPRSVARVCAGCSRTMRQLEFPARVRVAGSDVAIEPAT